MERTDRIDIRRRPADANCSECLTIASGLVEALIKWNPPASNRERMVACAVNLRVSCQETLDGQRLCPFVGQKREHACITLEIDYGEQGIEDLVAKHTGGMV